MTPLVRLARGITATLKTRAMHYAELHCLSNFSFLKAASHPDELVSRAAKLGYAGLAITDRNSLAGIVRAHTAVKNLGGSALRANDKNPSSEQRSGWHVPERSEGRGDSKDHTLAEARLQGVPPNPLSSFQLIIGAEITPMDAAPLVLWVKNRKGYANLCRLITLGRRRAEKGQCLLDVGDIANHAEGLIAGLLPPLRCDQFPLEEGWRYREIFGSECYLLAELHRGPHDHRRLEWLKSYSRETRLPLVAAGGVLFHIPARKLLQDVLTAVRHKTTIAQAGKYLLPNMERHLRRLETIRALYADVPQALARTKQIADLCTFSLEELRYEYPEELAPAGLSPLEYLKRLTWRGAKQRYPAGVPGHIRKLLGHELRLIEELHYEAYFLTVWDLVRFARSKNILCQGRGSAANSAVCYCLGITSVDPKRVGLLFERFISRERDEAPDIDVDFEHERREEVLQYIYEKYGRERAGLTAVTITYRPRSAIRDVGKALGLSLDLVDRLAKNADHYKTVDDFPKRIREAGLDPESEVGRRLIYLVDELQGFPRHLSQHVGGMVIARGRLDELVPIENAAMADRTVVEWNKDDLDDLGILKVDCLGLGMLTAIRKCFELIKPKTGRVLTLADVPEGDPKVYDMISRADTIGVFQIESRAQMSMLPRLKPRCYYDLVIEVAIVRPGPIQGNMVHPYLRRRNGEEPETYPNEAIRKVLGKTLGVPLFQEQCMQLAMVAAGFTPGEADQLRRAMGAWRRPGLIDQFRRKLMEGMKRNGFTGEFAEQVFQQIRGFGEYGFPESHAASFALLVYVSAWLKFYYPAEFAAAILNSQPMGFYAPAQLIQDARKHGVEVRPVDVNASDWDCTIEAGKILRLGFRLVRGFQSAWAERLVKARGAKAFSSMKDLLLRTRLPLNQVTILAEADAFHGLKDSRRESLWKALAADARPRQLLLFEQIGLDGSLSGLPEMALEEEVFADYRATGFSLRPHPMSFQRERLKQLGVVPAGDLVKLPNDASVKLAGVVLLRQRPSTAKGITFVTIEDETGTANLVLHQAVWEHYREITRHSPAWIVRGKVETKDTVIHVVVHRVEDLASSLEDLRLKSRDFR